MIFFCKEMLRRVCSVTEWMRYIPRAFLREFVREENEIAAAIS
jgi:hypothetical protein